MHNGLKVSLESNSELTLATGCHAGPVPREQKSASARGSDSAARSRTVRSPSAPSVKTISCSRLEHSADQRNRVRRLRNGGRWSSPSSLAALDRRQDPRIDRAQVEGGCGRRAGQGACRQAFLGRLPEHFEHSWLSEVVSPRTTAPGGVVAEGRVGASLDDAPVRQRQLGRRGTDDPDLSALGEGCGAIHSGQDLGRPRTANRALPCPHRSAWRNRKQLHRGDIRYRGRSQQETGVDLADRQRHDKAIAIAISITPI